MPANDLSIYSEYAHEWWIPGSPRFGSLQNITPFRLALIREWCGGIEGKDIFDLGCGGGLLAVPLIQEGARVVGIDQSERSVAVAGAAAAGSGTFACGDICSVPFPSQSADLVLLADVLDHIPSYPQALREAARLLRPGGKLFVSTLNRTWIGRLLTVVLGEGLRLIPPGTHDHRLFLKPEEIVSVATSLGLDTCHLQGEWPDFIQTIRHWSITLRKSRSTAVAYCLLFHKRTDEQ